MTKRTHQCDACGGTDRVMFWSECGGEWMQRACRCRHGFSACDGPLEALGEAPAYLLTEGEYQMAREQNMREDNE